LGKIEAKQNKFFTQRRPICPHLKQPTIKDTVGKLPKVGAKFYFRTAFAALVGKKPHMKPVFMGAIPQKLGLPTVSLKVRLPVTLRERSSATEGSQCQLGDASSLGNAPQHDTHGWFLPNGLTLRTP
jgi:hypothetical protein